MEWTEHHDVALLKEMLVSEIFAYKKGSPDRGKIWEDIQDRLNQVDMPKFNLKDNRELETVGI